METVVRKLVLVLVFTVGFAPAFGQEGKLQTSAAINGLPGLDESILIAQENVILFTQNLDSNSKENNVNAIVIEFQQYIDSLKGTRSRADGLLLKNFSALRQFFLTTTNKTSVATSFLSVGPPFKFCLYNDTATALHIGAVKNGQLYNLSKMTEKRIAKSALESCLLPSLNAFNEFKDTDVKYVGLSIYYGCRDSREGAPKEAVTAYCLTLVARLADVRDYAAGLLTAKGLLAGATLYLSDAEDFGSLKRVVVNTE